MPENLYSGIFAHWMVELTLFGDANSRDTSWQSNLYPAIWAKAFFCATILFYEIKKCFILLRQPMKLSVIVLRLPKTKS